MESVLSGHQTRGLRPSIPSAWIVFTGFKRNLLAAAAPAAKVPEVASNTPLSQVMPQYCSWATRPGGGPTAAPSRPAQGGYGVSLVGAGRSEPMDGRNVGALPSTGARSWAPGMALVVRGPLRARSRIRWPAGAQIGTLRDPSAVDGRGCRRDPEENAAEIQAIETRLACNCGCTLDVFTCRTTDFSCTYSPKLHREVLALRNQGKSAQQVLDAFVAKYGEKALMAPKPKGFNLAGYLVPGAAIAAAGAALVLVIGRRRRRWRPPAPARRRRDAGRCQPEELERLRQALAEVED